MRTERPGTTQPPQQSPASPAPVNSPSTGLIATTGTAAQHPVAGSSQQAQQQLHSSTGHTAQATTPLSTTRDVPEPRLPPTTGPYTIEWISLGSIYTNHKGTFMHLEAERCPFCYFMRYVTTRSTDLTNANGRDKHIRESHVEKTTVNTLYSKAATHRSGYTYVGKDSYKATVYQCERCRRCMGPKEIKTHSC